MMYNGKKIYVFDWDGTIFESMEIKFQNFTNVLCEYHKNDFVSDEFSKEKVLDLYKKLSGIPRKEIYKEIMQIFKVNFSENNYNKFSNHLSQKNKISLLTTTAYKDAIDFLDKLVCKKKIYISSSVPQDELSYLVKNKLPENILNNLSGIYGSKEGFSKGKEHFQKIITDENVFKSDIIFFGDDLMDLSLAKDANIDFILINRDNKKTEHKFLKDFNEGIVI